MQKADVRFGFSESKLIGNGISFPEKQTNLVNWDSCFNDPGNVS